MIQHSLGETQALFQVQNSLTCCLQARKFIPCLSSYSFHLVLEFPQCEFTASFNVSNTKKPLWEAGLKQLIFSPCASSNTSSLYPTTELPHFLFSCWCFLYFFSWFPLSEYSSSLCCCVFLAVPYWLLIRATLQQSLNEILHPCKSNLKKYKVCCWQKQ